MDTQREMQKKVIETEDEEEADKHCITQTESYRCASSAAEMKARYCSTIHDPLPTKTTLTTHDRSHSRRRGAAAKSTGDQSKKERVTVMTK